MVDNRRLLDDVIRTEIEGLSILESGSKEKAAAVEDLTKLYKVKIEDEKTEWEIYDKSKRREMEEFQAADQSKINKLKVGLDVLSLGAFVGLAIKGFKFEELGTITSDTTRRVLNQAMKLFKR